MKTTVHIRPASKGDARAMLDIYQPYVLHSPATFEEEEIALDVWEERIAVTMGSSPWLVAEVGGKVVGYAYASEHRSRTAYRWTKEVSAYVHEDFHRQGIASKLYRTLFELLQKQGVQTVLAGITVPNERSQQFHESMGFSLVGVYHRVGYRLEAWRDVGWWELTVGESGVPVHELRPWRD